MALTRARIRPRQFLRWAIVTFGPGALNRDERAARFVEEAIELAHAEDLPKAVIERILGRVYCKPRGDTVQEIGQAMAALECLAENVGVYADLEADRELLRVKSIPKEEWARRHAVKVAIAIANLSPAP